MRIALGYLLTPIYYFYFGLILAIFHPVQVGLHHLIGDRARKKSVDILNFLLVQGLYLLACRPRFYGFEKVPSNRSIIIVSNHQSMFDIPAVVHGFRKNYPRFISKRSLAKGLPSISYNLKHGKSALIDRDKGSQSVKEIFKLGQLIEENKHAVCIFPEGTRSKTGKVKKFMPAGIHTLMRAAPSAVIIPFVIDGNSRLMYKGTFPLNVGLKIKYTVLDPIEPKDHHPDNLVPLLQEMITKELKNSK